MIPTSLYSLPQDFRNKTRRADFVESLSRFSFSVLHSPAPEACLYSGAVFGELQSLLKTALLIIARLICLAI
jgi:hypothetical protein